MSRSVKSTTAGGTTNKAGAAGGGPRSNITAGTASSNRHFAKQATAAPTKEALQMMLREFDFRTVTWQGVEAKFRELYSLLSAPTSGLNAAQERIQQKEAVSSALVTFLDMCQAECRRLLAEGKERAAVEGGLSTLTLKREYYGNNSLQLVSAFFHLARTNQCLGHIKRAEEFLSLAQLQIMRHPDADDSLKGELHQIYGLLYASDGRQDQALKHLTCAAYHLSALNGPEHILTAFCYFDLGNVFAALGHMENTMAFYEKVKDIWYDFLVSAIQRMLEVDRQVRAAEDDEIAAAIAANAEKIMGEYATSFVGAENVQDAARMLQAIVALQRDRFGVVHPATARSELIHGMLLLWTGERTPAYETLVRAHEIAKRTSGERHEVATESASMLASFGMEVPADAALSVDELVRDIEQQKAAQEARQNNANNNNSGNGNNSNESTLQQRAAAVVAAQQEHNDARNAAASASDPEIPAASSTQRDEKHEQQPQQQQAAEEEQQQQQQHQDEEVTQSEAAAVVSHADGVAEVEAFDAAPLGEEQPQQRQEQEQEQAEAGEQHGEQAEGAAAPGSPTEEMVSPPAVARTTEFDVASPAAAQNGDAGQQ